MKVDAYIKRINSNDLTLTEICIPWEWNPGPYASDDMAEYALEERAQEIKPLVAALIANPLVKQRITSLRLELSKLGNRLNLHDFTALKKLKINSNFIKALDLSRLKEIEEADISSNLLTEIELRGLKKLKKLNISGNEITTLDLSGLESLEELDVSLTNLTLASIIALKNLQKLSPRNLEIKYPLTLPTITANTPLTETILDAHFKPILTIQPAAKDIYINKALALLLSIPDSLLIDNIFNILKYEIMEISRAQASMNNFKDIFSRLPDENNPQLQILTNYEDTKFKAMMAHTTRAYYDRLVKLKNSIQAIKAARASKDKVEPAILTFSSPKQEESLISQMRDLKLKSEDKKTVRQKTGRRRF